MNEWEVNEHLESGETILMNCKEGDSYECK